MIKICTFIRGTKMWWFSLRVYGHVFSVINPTFVSSQYLMLQLYLNWCLYLEWEVMFPYVRCQTFWGESVLGFTHIDTDFKIPSLRLSDHIALCLSMKKSCLCLNIVLLMSYSQRSYRFVMFILVFILHYP